MQEKNNEMNGAMSLEGFLYCIRHDVAKVLGKNFDVTLHQVTKNNGLKLDGLTIKESSTNIAPTIYLNASNFAHRFSLCTLKIQYLAVIQLSKSSCYAA